MTFIEALEKLDSGEYILVKKDGKLFLAKNPDKEKLDNKTLYEYVSLA